jgi:Ca2+-binding RTX toxin-like protein
MAHIIDTPQHAAKIEGTAQADTIEGLDLNDLIYGRSGADFLYGGDGNDELHGGFGADTLYGGAGDDFISGGAGNNTLYGGTGNDTFNFEREYVTPNAPKLNVIKDFDSGDVAMLDDFSKVSWDPAKANILSGNGYVIAHLEGHEGDTVHISHVGTHWELML